MTRLQKFMTGHIPKSNKNTLALIESFKKETILLEIVVGKLLGDSSINREGSLTFCHSIKQKEYIEHCYELFKSYIRKGIGIHSQKRQRLGVGNVNEELSFSTRPIFKEYLPLFYIYEENKTTRTKVVPKIIEELLTFRSLAYWIMDDGKKSGKNIEICSYSFTKIENEFLIKVLQTKLNIECELKQTINFNNKEQFWYFIKIYNNENFWNKIKEYVIPSMYYKFNK